MKRRARPLHCTPPQFSTGCDTRFERLARGVFLLLLLLLPQRTVAIWRACPFQSKADASGLAAGCVAGPSTAGRSLLCAGESWCVGFTPPSACPAALYASNALCCTLLTGGETLTTREGSHPLGENRGKRNGNFCGLRNNRAAYRLSASVPSRPNRRAPLKPQRLSLLRCLSCPPLSSFHVSTRRAVSLNKRQSTFPPWSSISCFIRYATVRHLTHQSSLVPVSLMKHFPSGWLSPYSVSVRWSRFCPAVSPHKHAVFNHVSDGFSHQPGGEVRNDSVPGRHSPAKFCAEGKTAGGCLLLSSHCNARRAQFCINPERHRYKGTAAQRAGCSLLDCPRGHNLPDTRFHQSYPANSAWCASIQTLQHGGHAETQGVSETNCLTATKAFAEGLQTDWNDDAALQNAENREQEAFERMASQVESQLCLETHAFTAGARNPFQRQSLVNDDCQSRALQQPDQHGHHANPPRPTADFYELGLKKGKPEQQRHGCRNGERVAQERSPGVTAGEQGNPQQLASTVLKGCQRAGGTVRALQVCASVRTGATSSPQISITHHDFRQEAGTETPTSVPALPGRLHASELCRSGKSGSNWESSPSRSAVEKRQRGATGRHTLADRRLVRAQLKRKREIQLDGTEQDCLQKPLQNDHDQLAQLVEVLPRRQDCGHNSTAATQGVQMSVQTSRPVQRDGGKLEDAANRETAGAGDDGRRRDRRLIHLLLQSNSVSDVWRLLRRRNIQLLSGAGLVGVVQRLAFLCATAERQNEEPRRTSESTLERKSIRVDGVGSSVCGSERNRRPFDTSTQVPDSIKLQRRAELKKHPIFKDILNALPAKIDSLRASEAAALLHALATLRIRSAPDLLHRTGAVIAAKAFGTGTLKNFSVKPTRLLERLEDVTVGRLWTSVDMLPMLQHHPLREALTRYTIKRLKTVPERSLKGEQEFAAAGKESGTRVVDLQNDDDDSRGQDPSNGTENHRAEPLTAATAAIIAKVAVQMRLGSQDGDFVRTLQSYLLRLLVDQGSETLDGTLTIRGKPDTKAGAKSRVLVRLVLSLANLRKQQEELTQARHPVPPERSPVSPGFPAGGLEEQIALTTGRRPTRSCTNVNESPSGNAPPSSGIETASSHATETAVEDDEVFLKALGTYFSRRIGTVEPARVELSRLLKALNYFYGSSLCKLQAKMHTKTGRTTGCRMLRSFVTFLPRLVVAAAVVIKQKEDSFDDLVGVADLLINLNSLLETSKALRKMTEGGGTIHVDAPANRDGTTGKGELFAGGAEQVARLAQKVQESEWRRGEEFVQAVSKNMAERLHDQLEALLQKLRKKKETQKDSQSRDERILSGTVGFEATSVAPTHMALLAKSQELLNVLLKMNCPLTGDRLVECVRILVNFCETSPSSIVRSGDDTVYKEVEQDGDAFGKKTTTRVAGRDNSESKSTSQCTVVSNRRISTSVSVRPCATHSNNSSEEERLRWRRHLLDGTLLFRVKAMHANCSIRRAVQAVNTADELLSAVVSNVELRQLSAWRLNTTDTTVKDSRQGGKVPPSKDFQEVLEGSSAHAGVDPLATCLDDLTLASALHRLALLQRRQHDDRGTSGSQSSDSQIEAPKKDGRALLYDPRMHLLLQAVATRIPTMGQQVTRVMWALEKLHFFDQRGAVENGAQSVRLQPLQQSSLHARGTPWLAGARDAGIQNAATPRQTFLALRRNITVLLLQRLAELTRADCLSGAELSAALHVLAGKSFSTTASDSGSPDWDTSSWTQAADTALQDIRRGVSSSLLRTAPSLSGLDASVALYSLAVLGWTASTPCRSPSLINELVKTDAALSEPGGAQERAASDKRHVNRPDFFKQHKADSSAKPTSSSYSSRKIWQNVEALSEKVNMDSPGRVRDEDELREKESCMFSALLQRLTEEVDNCNVQTLVVALWAVAITAGQRQQFCQGQNANTGERKENCEAVKSAVSDMMDVETRTFGRCTQNETFGLFEHEGEEPLTYEKPVWLSPVEKAFLAAVGEKLEKQIAHMGMAPLSMLLLSALILRWRQPTLLLNAIRRALDALRMHSRETTAQKVDCNMNEEAGQSKGAEACLFHGPGELQKTGELHSRVWAVLAMLQQQCLFSLTSQIDTPEKKIGFKPMQDDGDLLKKTLFDLSDLWRVKRQAAVQLKEDLETALRTTAWIPRPQRDWAIQHVQSLLLSCMTMEEDRVQHQQQLDFRQDSAAVADSPTLWFVGADDTGQIMREVFFLLERLTISLLTNAAAHIDAVVELGPQRPKQRAVPQGQSAAQGEAHVLRAADPSTASVSNTETDTEGEAVGSELMRQHLRLTNWVKRLSLLLFALRRLRQLFPDSPTQENDFRETNSIHSFREEAQLTPSATLPSHEHSRQQRQQDFPYTKLRHMLGHTNVSCTLTRRTLLAVAAQLIIAMLRSEDLSPRHPQLPSLLFEFHELLADSLHYSAAGDSGQSPIVCFSADSSGPSAKDDAAGKEDTSSDAHTWQDGKRGSVTLNTVTRKLGEALTDWVCLHLEETDDRMYNVVLPLLQTLGAQTHLLSALHRIALQPVKEGVRTQMSESDVRTPPFTSEKLSKVRDAGIDPQGRSSSLQPLHRTGTKLTVLPYRAHVSYSQQPLLRRSRAASLALMLHHRHRIAFHPPSMHFSLVQSATEHAELLAAFPSDAAHALCALQRWKAALGRTEIGDYPDTLDLQSISAVFSNQPSMGSGGQKSFSPLSNAAPVLTAAAPNGVLLSRSQLLVNGLNQPLSSNIDALQSKKSNVSTSSAVDTHPTIKDASGTGPNTSARTQGQDFSPSAEVPSVKSCENRSPKHSTDSGLTQWDMLPLAQLVHASTAAAQLLELPSANSVWKRASPTSDSLISGAGGTAISRPYVCGTIRCTRMKFNSESSSDNLDARRGQSSCSCGLAAAAAALTRRLLQQSADTPYSGPLTTFFTLSQETDSSDKSESRQFVRKQRTLRTAERSCLQNNADDNTSTCNIPPNVSMQTSSAKSDAAKSARLFTDTHKDSHKPGDSGGRLAVRHPSVVAVSWRGWRRFRAFVKAKRDWLAAAGALRLLGGGHNPEDVTQALVNVACEIADLLEGYTGRAAEREEPQQNWEEKDRAHSMIFPGEEELELVDVEKQLSLDEGFFEEEDNIYAATVEPETGHLANSLNKFPQRNWGKELEKQQLVLVQQLACSCLEEISFQLRALQARSALYRRRGHSAAKTHFETAAQAMRVIGARILGALASVAVLPINAAAFLLQPALVILGTEGDEHAVGSQQVTLSHSPQTRLHVEASPLAEVYITNLTVLLRRLLPLAPQWAPRLGSHRAAALFSEIAENVEYARLCQPQQFAGGGVFSAGGLFRVGSAPGDALASLPDAVKQQRREGQKTSLVEKSSLQEGDGNKLLARSFTRTQRQSKRLQETLLGLQKTIIAQVRCSPGRIARFWRAVTLQGEAIGLPSGNVAAACSASREASSQTAKSTTNSTVSRPADHWNTSRDKAVDREDLVRCEEKFANRLAAYRTVFTTVVEFLDELAASAVRASQADLQKNLRGEGAAHSAAPGRPTFGRTAAASRTAAGYIKSNHSDKTGDLSSCAAAARGMNSVDWIYGAVAAAGSGLLVDGAQQCIATAAAQISDGPSAYFALLSFLANSRDAPARARASLAQMLATAARGDLTATRAADVSQASSNPAQTKDNVRKQESEQTILQRGEVIAEMGHPVEGTTRERVIPVTLNDAENRSTRLSRLAKAAWLIWIATSLQQPKHGERASVPRRGHTCQETLGVPKSVGEQDNHSAKLAKQALEELSDAIFDLLQQEVSRLKDESVYSSHSKQFSSSDPGATATSAEVYRLLILSLDTLIKMYPEDGERGSSCRLSRIEAVLGALNSLIDAATYKTPQASSGRSSSQRKTLSFLSFPSLPSLAYIVHLLRQARVHYAPLLNAISVSIRWHRQRAHSRDGEPSTGDDISRNSGSHLQDTAAHALPGRWGGRCCHIPTSGCGNVDIWPSLLLLADAAAYQPQEALISLKRELLLFVECLVQDAPLTHVVRILRFSMNATPISDILSFHQRDRGSNDNLVTHGKSTAEILGASKSSTRQQLAEESRARRVYDNIVHRCMTEGAPLLLKLRPNGKDWSDTLEEQLAKLETNGYAPVGLIDTLNKMRVKTHSATSVGGLHVCQALLQIHLLHTLSEARTGGATAAEKEMQGTDHELLPKHVQLDSSVTSLEREAGKRTKAKRSRRKVHYLGVPSESSGWWPQILRWIVKHYIGKRSSGLHKAVSGVLSRTLHIPHQNEVWTATGLSVDIVLDQRAADGRPIAVEVDGPTHYVTALVSSPAAERGSQDRAVELGGVQLSSSSGREQLPTALTQFKRQLLEQTGWHVVSIPFYEWAAPSRTSPPLPNSEQRKTADSKRRSKEQLEPAKLGGRNYAKRLFATEEQYSVFLVAAKLRPLLTNPPFDTKV